MIDIPAGSAFAPAHHLDYTLVFFQQFPFHSGFRNEFTELQAVAG
jgi:hypothetical protein